EQLDGLRQFKGIKNDDLNRVYASEDHAIFVALNDNMEVVGYAIVETTAYGLKITDLVSQENDRELIERALKKHAQNIFDEWEAVQPTEKENPFPRSESEILLNA